MRIDDLSDWSYPVVSSNSVRVRPLGMALVMCVLVNSATALLLPEACEPQARWPVRGYGESNALRPDLLDTGGEIPDC